MPANLMHSKMSNAHKREQQKLTIKFLVSKVIDMFFCFQLNIRGLVYDEKIRIFDHEHVI